MTVCFFKLIFNVYLFLKERQNVKGGGAERERDTESEAGSRLLAVHTGPKHGAQTHKPRNHDLSQSQKLNQLSHPGTPMPLCFYERPTLVPVFTQ